MVHTHSREITAICYGNKDEQSTNASFLRRILLSTNTLSVPWNKAYNVDNVLFHMEVSNHENDYIAEMDAVLLYLVDKYNIYIMNV